MNARPMGLILDLFVKTMNYYSLAVINAGSLYQLTIFGVSMLQVNLNQCNYKFYIDIYIQRN